MLYIIYTVPVYGITTQMFLYLILYIILYLYMV